MIGLKAKRFQQEAVFGSQVMLKGGFSDSLVDKESACNVGDLDSIPGLGRSPGEGKGYPFQYSGLENSMDCIVHEVSKSRTHLSFYFNDKRTYEFHIRMDTNLS